MTADAPILIAYRYSPSSLVVWCGYCQRWHWHSPGDGHRVAHCLLPTSPYHTTGYILVERGPITEAAMRRYARAQRRQTSS